MSVEGARPKRVAESIRRELAPMLDALARDEGLGLVSIAAVDVSPDLRQAKILVSSIGNTSDEASVLDSLTAWRGDMRTHLANALRLRRVPDLRFVLDTSMSEQARLTTLLRDQDPDEL